MGAVVYIEPSDAGQTLATAADTGLTAGGSGTLTGIAGTIGTGTDADLFLFNISDPVTFTATAVGGASSVAGNGQIDTSLFLFDAAGNALVANDDQTTDAYYQSSFTLTLTPGAYYLGVSLSGNEPVNANGQLLFTVDQPTTGVRGPTAGLNPTAESDFDGQTFVAETGTYSVGISAVPNVPEPSTAAALGLGTLLVFAFLHRARRQRPS